MNTAQKATSNNYIRSNENKCRATWNMISSSISETSCKADIAKIKFNDQIYTNPHDISEILNIFLLF